MLVCIKAVFRLSPDYVYKFRRSLHCEWALRFGVVSVDIVWFRVECDGNFFSPTGAQLKEWKGIVCFRHDKAEWCANWEWRINDCVFSNNISFYGISLGERTLPILVLNVADVHHKSNRYNMKSVYQFGWGQKKAMLAFEMSKHRVEWQKQRNHNSAPKRKNASAEASKNLRLNEAFEWICAAPFEL